MFINHNEYQTMYEAEETLWWYRFLHQKTLREVHNKAKDNKEIAILDVGCGTGGMMNHLRKNGYHNVRGIDYSTSAVHFCQERGQDVSHLSVDDLTEKFAGEQFDVIISNDVMCTLNEDQIKKAFKSISSLLKPEGIFISNNNAFEIFGGTHDIAVGSKHRFTRKSLEGYYSQTALQPIKSTYWSMLLSPLILLVRLTQQVKIKWVGVNEATLRSDVSVPPKIINELLYQLVLTEERLIRSSPFGSSLFTVFKKQ